MFGTQMKDYSSNYKSANDQPGIMADAIVTIGMVP